MDTERLVVAVDGDDVPAVEAALAAGADVNARLRGGGTLLMRAAAEGRRAAARALLRGGADVDAQRDDGMTALMLASFFGHSDVVSALLAWGADINAEDTHEFTALRLASSKCHFEMIGLLERAGAAKPTTASAGAAPESPVRPYAQSEPTCRTGGQEKDHGKVNVSMGLPVKAMTSEGGAPHPELCLEESVPPRGNLLYPSSKFVGPARAGGVRMLAVGACAIVLLFVGFQRTLVRSSEETAPAPAAPPAVDVGAQPTTPMAPPQGQKETASAEPAAAPAPPQISTAAEDTGGNRAADAPAELQKAPSHRQHPAELAVVSTAQTPAPPPQADSGRPDVKEAGGSAHAEKAPAVIVVATPRDVPQSRARQGEQPTTVAPPLSSSAPKKKVIPWP